MCLVFLLFKCQTCCHKCSLENDISVQERWKISVQNLIELATISLTKSRKSIKWLGLAVYTAVSLVLESETRLKIKAEEEGGDFPRSL